MLRCDRGSQTPHGPPLTDATGAVERQLQPGAGRLGRRPVVGGAGPKGVQGERRPRQRGDGQHSAVGVAHHLGRRRGVEAWEVGPGAGPFGIAACMRSYAGLGLQVGGPLGAQPGRVPPTSRVRAQPSALQAAPTHRPGTPFGPAPAACPPRQRRGSARPPAAWPARRSNWSAAASPPQSPEVDGLRQLLSCLPGLGVRAIGCRWQRTVGRRTMGRAAVSQRETEPNRPADVHTPRSLPRRKNTLRPPFPPRSWPTAPAGAQTPPRCRSRAPPRTARPRAASAPGTARPS